LRSPSQIPTRPVGEERLLTFGSSLNGRLLAVAHTGGERTLRIISARVATRRERKIHEEG
jgi:hypothetical protein